MNIFIYDFSTRSWMQTKYIKRLYICAAEIVTGDIL